MRPCCKRREREHPSLDLGEGEGGEPVDEGKQARASKPQPHHRTPRRRPRARAFAHRPAGCAPTILVMAGSRWKQELGCNRPHAAVGGHQNLTRLSLDPEHSRCPSGCQLSVQIAASCAALPGRQSSAQVARSGGRRPEVERTVLRPPGTVARRGLDATQRAHLTLVCLMDGVGRVAD